MPLCVTQPTTRSPRTFRSATSCWNKLQVRLRLEKAANRALVQLAVRLRPGGAHRGSLAGIERSKLDARLVGGKRHGTAERIDLLDQVAFADAPDRRIAAHLPQRLDAVREQERAPAHARGGERRLGARMAAADHDHVEFWSETHELRNPPAPFASRVLYHGN